MIKPGNWDKYDTGWIYGLPELQEDGEIADEDGIYQKNRRAHKAHPYR